MSWEFKAELSTAELAIMDIRQLLSQQQLFILLFLKRKIKKMINEIKQLFKIEIAFKFRNSF